MKEKTLGKYTNGTYNVLLLNDGTKIRGTHDKETTGFIPEYPESMDINITNRCDLNCPFCYAGAEPNGKHAEILDIPFFDTLKEHTEIAINGNDLSHPDLIVFLQRMRAKNIYVGLTVNQTHFLKNLSLLKFLEDKKLVYGIGVSIVNPSEELIEELKNFKTTVAHVVNGIVSVKNMQILVDNNIPTLILGYKQRGRGKAYYSQEVITAMDNLEKNILSFMERGTSLSFDNLALEQLYLKNKISPKLWDKYYMGNDGDFTLYIDLVDKTFSKNSMCDDKKPITYSAVEMFNIIRQETDSTFQTENLDRVKGLYPDLILDSNKEIKPFSEIMKDIEKDRVFNFLVDLNMANK